MRETDGPPTARGETVGIGTLRALLRSKYLSLILYKTYADLRAESARTYVGYIWWFVEPVLSMTVYYVVFELFLERGTDHFIAFLFVGLVPWRWTSTTLMHGSSSILSARSLMNQVYLPKVVFPLVSILTDTVKFLIVFAVVLLFVAISGFPVGLPHLALPFLLVVHALLVTAVTLVVAAVTPFLPDLRMVLENLVRLWFFLSGVFFAVSSLSERAQLYLRLNPMATIIESYRDILLYGAWPHLGRLALIGIGCLILVPCAVGLIQRSDYSYPKLAF